MLKRMPLKSLFACLIAGLTMVPAMASSVTYNLSATSGVFSFTGSFSFDTITDAVSNKSLQSTGGPVENWMPVTQPFLYDGAYTSGWDLLFYSVSKLVPLSPGDIAGFLFANPLDGVSADSIYGGDYTFVYEDPPLGLTEGDPQGCVTPGPACGLAATPLPSTWLMLLGALVGLGFFAYRGTKKDSAVLAAA
jgi:hypothetical protein